MRAGIHQVVTFSSDPFGGNPAFVVSLEAPAPDHVMRAVAAQLSETVLATLTPIDAARTRLVFHTPTGRHQGAGHAMMAAAHVALARAPAGDRMTFVLDDGSECVVGREGGLISVPWPIMQATAIDMAGPLDAALRRKATETLDSAFGFIAIYDDPADVAKIDPDQDAIARLERGAVIATAPGEGSDFVLRVFAPRLGLPEDPVCGTAHRILVPLWADRLNRSTLHSRQLSPRGGDLWCRVEGSDVVLAGEFVTFLSGSLELPD